MKIGLSGAGRRFHPPKAPVLGVKRTLGQRDGNRDSEHYDRKLETILRKAAAVFCSRGYHQASIRDISRATGVSLAGLYYYFHSKEQLLYLIQRHAFEGILDSARTELQRFERPEDRLRAFVRLHLQFFLDHPNEMKVLTHEEEWLADIHARDLHAIKKAYYKLCLDQVDALRRASRLKGLDTRVAVLSLFGMMNWIYSWYNPKVDPRAEEISEQMTRIFLDGIRGLRTRAAELTGSPAAHGKFKREFKLNVLSGARPEPHTTAAVRWH